VPIVTIQQPSVTEDCGPNPGNNDAFASALNNLVVEDFVGQYEHIPLQNNWHEVTLFVDESGQLWWLNKAGVSWKLYLQDGVLSTGEDCPYGPGDLNIKLLTDGDGMPHSMPDALVFNGGTYARVWSSAP